ncbi:MULTISPECIES: 50S ribosomal protein L15 [Thalassospira]|jgi:large subunit ribosomal protein L15|uniref:Large ribosomal subunit protein uL15 n=3 Tax=Thalassospira TaxID=168934 RepID=A0ABR5Y168_9PROT|nr:MULTISPECIES: 50S ribosomal protein L15 [Thalassospira]MAL28750.1 50S ribosomal protein L15 [Thalassospira sp.]MBR9818858.1 50S ribosomal protein L15 [Rhodospirillales bacterium]UKV15899.1 50S ribosomal protein L15 [Thalassospiraceae bacterium SW-3-3]KEO54851.1 50S ribosomal protein L15 [Thalassospira permensis NBRC 106175]KZD02931.1 50S ribosomal protein L15 [Thalassospira xiamenensis]|tara:strand:- start:5233 stop:5718 length:486 start_codon:yes stop_codon:yes gene_type:complete
MKLNELADNPGARKARTRVGRGIGSGKGKTSGAGQKGQTSRSGVAINGFEGGQMPIYRRLPKRGFKNPFRKLFGVVNLGTLQTAVDNGVLEEGANVTIDVLVEKGLARPQKDGLRLLAKGELKAKLNIEITGASKSAIEAVEKAGGSVKVLAPVAAAETAE